MNIKWWVIGGGMLMAAYAAHRASQGIGKLKDAAVELATKDLNPASDKNLVYRGVNKVGSWVSGRESFDLGKSIFHWING